MRDGNKCQVPEIARVVFGQRWSPSPSFFARRLPSSARRLSIYAFCHSIMSSMAGESSASPRCFVSSRKTQRNATCTLRLATLCELAVPGDRVGIAISRRTNDERRTLEDERQKTKRGKTKDEKRKDKRRKTKDEIRAEMGPFRYAHVRETWKQATRSVCLDHERSHLRFLNKTLPHVDFSIVLGEVASLEEKEVGQGRSRDGVLDFCEAWIRTLAALKLRVCWRSSWGCVSECRARHNARTVTTVPIAVC